MNSENTEIPGQAGSPETDRHDESARESDAGQARPDSTSGTAASSGTATWETAGANTATDPTEAAAAERAARRARHRATAPTPREDDLESTMVRRRSLFVQPEPGELTFEPPASKAEIAAKAGASVLSDEQPATPVSSRSATATPEVAAEPPSRRTTSPADSPRTAPSAASTEDSTVLSTASADEANPGTASDSGPMRPLWRRPSAADVESASGAAHLAASAGTTADLESDPDPDLTAPEPEPEPERPSRAAAHWAGVLTALLLLPPAWFLISDGATRLAPAAHPYTFTTSGTGLAELLGGCAALVVALLAACRSTLGTTIVGALTTILGVVGLALPGVMTTHIAPLLERMADHSGFGRSMATALWQGLAGGRFLACGLALLFLALAVHGARRAGRREQAARSRARLRSRHSRHS